MEAKYEMDMQTNFLILDGKCNASSNYASKMILGNNILGLLKVELRSVDDKDYFYYNITSKDSLFNIYENKLLDYLTLKNILIKIINILERSDDYLLEEECFLLKPEFIYIDQDSEEPFLCYYVDYKEPLIEQFSRLLEYFMNKVDYKDEKAVLLVYALYKITKGSNITFEHLKEELHKDIASQESDYKATNQENDLEKDCYNTDYSSFDSQPTYRNMQGSFNENNSSGNKSRNLLEKDNDKDFNAFNSTSTYTNTISDLDQFRDEKEVLKFSKSSYIIAAILVVIITGIFITIFQTKLLYNSFGTQIDIVKLVCFIIIMACITGLILSKVFHKDRKIVQVIPNDSNLGQFYSQSNLNSKSYESLDNTDINNYQAFSHENTTDSDYQNPDNNNYQRLSNNNYSTEILKRSIDEEDNKTVILADLRMNQKTYYLESIDNNEDIYINLIPFIIGKNEKGVNHRINDPSVSRFHARLLLCDEKITITDLGSTNGTYINGEEIKEHTPYDLSVNDVVSLSKCGFTLKEKQQE